MVVADVEDVISLYWPGFVVSVVQDLAAGVLRAGDAEQERERRREVDGADAGDGVAAVRDAGPAATNVACMLTLCGDVDQVRQVAVLAEELRERDALPGVAASNWYGGRRTTTTSPLRLGCSESLAVDVAELLLLHDLERRPARRGWPGRSGSGTR